MIIGCVKEIKKNEFRVGLTPDNAKEYIAHGHSVVVEKNLGLGSGFSNEEYIVAGATIACQSDVWAKSDMLIKVKEPIEAEYPLMRKGQIIYTYLHLAANEPLTKAMLKCGCYGVAYETLKGPQGDLPLLKPMSEISGRLSVLEGAKCLEKHLGGKGILLSGVPGVRKANVLILGGGFVGTNACRMAIGLGADVTIADVSLPRLTYLDELFDGRVKTIYSTPTAIKNELKNADLVIGSVLIPGAKAPKLVTREDLKLMKAGSVIVDVAVDQGGCFETTKATYHDNPTFIIDEIVHYCVANIPGAVEYTSTMALTNATLSYGLKIANMGIKNAAKSDNGILSAINIYEGNCTFKGVADAFSLPLKTLF